CLKRDILDLEYSLFIKSQFAICRVKLILLNFKDRRYGPITKLENHQIKKNQIKFIYKCLLKIMEEKSYSLTLVSDDALLNYSNQVQCPPMSYHALAYTSSGTHSQGLDSFCSVETYFTVPVCVSSDTIRSNVNGSRITSVVALNLSKAFNNINHQGLIMKLAGQFGFSKLVYKLVYSYLTWRYQFVDINGVYSIIYRIYGGVLQGSALGLCFFMLYVNKLPDLMRSNCCEPYLYADDIFLLLSKKSGD
uniref:Reverse transcriptase domain-containing protein n=1 Tax=Glossina palpalis gambiensis TaxID=67801 RepID=A0A1B0BXI4_9MUSC